MKIQIINGPNLNLLGVREPGVYGRESFTDFLPRLRSRYPDVEIHYFQSNVEGELVSKIQEVGFSFEGLILRGGAHLQSLCARGVPPQEHHHIQMCGPDQWPGPRRLCAGGAVAAARQGGRGGCLTYVEALQRLRRRGLRYKSRADGGWPYTGDYHHRLGWIETKKGSPCGPFFWDVALAVTRSGRPSRTPTSSGGRERRGRRSARWRGRPR